MLRATDLSLDRAIQYAKSKVTQQHAEFMKSNKSPASSIDYMREKNAKTSHATRGYSTQSSAKEVINSCKFCSYTHVRGACPTYNRTCNRCNINGHFPRCCPKVDVVQR